MKPISKSNFIQMPLTIGVSQVMSNQKQKLQINSLDYIIKLDIKNDIHLKKFLKLNNNKKQFICCYKQKSDKQINIFSEENQDLLQLNIEQKNNKNTFTLYKAQIPTHLNDSFYQFGFIILISHPENTNKLHLQIIQQNLYLELIKLSSVKFVRNKLLTDILTSQPSQQKGLLTMDQSGRFLIQKLTMKFPVIGFWLKTQQNVNSLIVFNHFSQFINKKYDKRCIFKQNQSNSLFFYFVRLNKENRMQTYVVSWNSRDPYEREILLKQSVKVLQISSQNIFFQQQTKQNNKTCLSLEKKKFISSCQNSSNSNSSQSEQNGMDFTLRRYKHKNQLSTLQSLINYSYLSPIKQLQNSDKQDNLFSDTYQNSPQFSTLMKQNHSQSECFELKNKINEQEQQIKKLKQIILEMQSQLKLYKNSRMSTQCESNKKKPKFASELSSPQTNQFSLNSNPQSKNSSPQQIKRLRQSDLKSNSVSHSGYWLKNSSNKKSLQMINCQKINECQQNFILQNSASLTSKQLHEQKLNQYLPQITEEDARDPWDYMQIIQG